jgi:hypothetical protein
MPKHKVRDAVLELLRKSPEPATVRELTTAAYYFTGDDRVTYAAVNSVLRFLARDGLVEQTDGMWRAVS